MSQRTLWILASLAAALSVHVYFFEWAPPPFLTPGRLFPHLMGPAEIQEMVFERPGRAAEAAAGVDLRPVKVRREGSDGEWWIVEPIRFPAHHPRVQSIAFELVDLTRIAQAPEAASAFAAGPALVLRFKTADGTETSIEVGADHPDPRFELTYVQVGGNRFVTRKEFRKLVDVGLQELRSRALLSMPHPDIATVEIAGTPRSTKKLSRNSRAGRWRLQAPSDGLADRELVEEMLTALNAWTIASFERDGVQSPEELRPYGLDSPRATVTLRSFGGRTVGLEVGSEVPGATPALVFVRSMGDASVYRADAVPTRWLFDDAEALRARYLFDWALDEVVEISGGYSASGDSLDPARPPAVTLRRQAAGGAAAASSTSAWEAMGPDGGKCRADTRIIEGQLAMLDRLLVQKFESEPLAVERGKLVIRTRAGNVQEVLLGERSTAREDAGLNLYRVMTRGEPTAVLVSTTLPLLLEEGVEAFRDRSVSNLQPETVLELSVHDDERSWDLARLPGEPWMLAGREQKAEEKPLDAQLIQRLLVELSADRLRAVRFLPQVRDYASVQLPLHGPRRGISIHRLHQGEPSFRALVLGTPVEDSRPRETRARMDTPGLPVFTVDDAVPAALAALVAQLAELTKE